MAEVPDFHHLNVFARVVEERSVSGGARAAGLSQPTVSGHLATLEKALGVRLFDRVDGEISPTQIGQALYRHALDLLRRRREALEEIDALKGVAGGELDIGGSNIPGVYLLPPLLAGFQSDREGVQLHLRVGDSQEIADAVVAGALDLAVIGNEPAKGPLHARAIGRDALLCVVGEGHPWAGKRKLPAGELAKQPYLSRERGSGTRALVDRALAEAGVAPETLHVVAELGSNEAVKQSVIAGLGFAFVSERSVQAELTHGLLHQVPVEGVRFERPFYLIADRRRSPSPLRRAFEDYLVTAMRE